MTGLAQRVHLTYTEPSGWTCPPRCLPSVAAADQLRKAITALAGPDAAARRTWSIRPCDCPEVNR